MRATNFGLSTREPLFHIEANSVLAVNLRKGEIQRRKYGGRYFTVIPLLENGSPIGAISMTDYRESIPNDEIQRLEFETVVNLVLPLITRRLSNQRVAFNSEWSNLCTDIAENIKALDPNATDYFSKITDLLSAKLNVGLFLGRLDPSNRQVKVLATSGYTDDIKKSYLDFKFYAVSHNEQGPMPLAINRRKTITHPSFGWIKGVLHPQSIKLGELFGTESCAAVPILSEEDVWGVLWMESKTPGYFSVQSETGLAQIKLSIEDSLSKMKLKQAHDRVKATVPATVTDRRA